MADVSYFPREHGRRWRTCFLRCFPSCLRLETDWLHFSWKPNMNERVLFPRPRKVLSVSVNTSLIPLGARKREMSLKLFWLTPQMLSFSTLPFGFWEIVVHAYSYYSHVIWDILLTPQTDGIASMIPSQPQDFSRLPVECILKTAFTWTDIDNFISRWLLFEVSEIVFPTDPL